MPTGRPQLRAPYSALGTMRQWFDKYVFSCIIIVVLYKTGALCAEKGEDMAFVNMKCPNCGGALQGEPTQAAQFECPYCHATVLNILDVKVDGDIENIDAEEFIRRLNEQKSKFVIRVDRQYKVVDVQTAVINGKLQEAERLLALGNYSGALSTLYGVPHDIPAAARILLLAANNSANEYHLMLGEGPLAKRYLLSVFDEETQESYRRIEDVRKENARVAQEIAEGYKLINEIFLPKEAYSYALNMCTKYPSSPHAWDLLGDIKHQIDASYGEYAPSKEKVIARELDYAMNKGLPNVKPPEVSSAECRTDFLLECAACGNLYTPASTAFACPACGHEQTNDEIKNAPSLRDKAEACKKEYENAFCVIGPRRYRNGMLALLIVTLIALFIEVVVAFNAAGNGITPAKQIVFTVINALVLIAVCLVLLRLLRNFGKTLRRHAELYAVLEKFGIYRWEFYNEGQYSPGNTLVNTEEFPSQFKKAVLPAVLIGLFTALLLVAWTVALFLL